MSAEEKDPNEMLSAPAAGKLLGVSGKTVVRLMENGVLPGYRIGGTWKYKRGEIEHYRDSQRYQPEKPPPSSEQER